MNIARKSWLALVSFFETRVSAEFLSSHKVLLKSSLEGDLPRIGLNDIPASQCPIAERVLPDSNGYASYLKAAVLAN